MLPTLMNYGSTLQDPSASLSMIPKAMTIDTDLPCDWRVKTIFASVLFNSMTAGMMFIFSNTVLPSLATFPDATGMAVMNMINSKIQNPTFLCIFMGGLLELIPAVDLCCCWHRDAYSKRTRGLVAASALVYFFGLFVITATQHIPRNDQLATYTYGSSAAEEFWQHEYLGKWAAWNTARALFAALSAGLGILSLMSMSKESRKST